MRVLVPNFWKRGGLVTVVVQDFITKEVLMVANTDEAGYKETLETGFAVYFSTTHQKRWVKGESSGNYQCVRQILIDCDGDAIIYLVEQRGSACHTEAKSCFYRTFSDEKLMPAPKAGCTENLLFKEMEVMFYFTDPRPFA